MSFQNFRLGDISLHQTLPTHHPTPPANTASSAAHFVAHVEPVAAPFTAHPARPHAPSSSAAKPPYGSGDTDDGYTLVFPNIEAFSAWRNSEEERNMVEFVKGDTHGSKAIPPRFKDHTKLVCARHSRSGRKKYIKKHPERVRKVPSRKLEGQGCLASISYKTYFDSEEVRACYNSQHSHEIGPANLPFTRRGRKAAVQQEKERSRNKGVVAIASGDSGSAGPIPSPDTPSAATASSSMRPTNTFSSAVAMLAPLPPNQPSFQPTPAPAFTYSGNNTSPYPITPPHNLAQERWENMATLFHSVREHARSFEYPTASVAALETVLIRLYLESPVGLGLQQSMGLALHNGNQPPSASTSMANQSANGHVSSPTDCKGSGVQNPDESLGS